MKIVKHSWKWAYPLSRRVGPPRFCDWHHLAASKMTPARLHALHLPDGWAGFPYNLYVRKNGSIHQGRPMQFCGGGAKGHWEDIGVALEGNWDVEKKMPAKQLAAAQWVHDYIDERYSVLSHRGHRDVPGNATACPGRYMPMNSILAGVQTANKTVKLTDRQKTIRRPISVRAGWRNLGLRRFLDKVRDQGDGKRIVITATHITFPIPSKRPWWWAKMLEWSAEQDAPAVLVVKEVVAPVRFDWRKLLPWKKR